ncbi:MAG: hypothetical protein ISR82_05820 [Candidatus Marinimicrobia bacterium]|nr:hypothetical protein [Candidatus Neomarinimicrobiota bacterium]MBL7010721.1 hypothetical protein [Candidatus Neomarinimicrobiota bacterium]MBL7029888.1 hypothetical protein [Candidatus Neomarinimicrobiota bacterium]
MKRFPIFIFALSILWGQHPGDGAVRAGVDAFYNYEFDRSIEILSQARKDFPDHPGVHVTWAAANWRRNEAYLPQDEIYSNLDANLDEIQVIYESQLDKFPGHPEYMLYMGTAKGLDARILLGQKQWLPTLYAAFQGFRIIQKAFEKDPYLTDAYLPIGIVEYYAGLSNVLVQAGAEMFGLDASREEGIRKIEVAATQSQWAWTEAMSILSFIYQFSDINNARGLEVSRTLFETYPKNFDFHVHYVESLLRNGKLTLAKKELNRLNQRLPKLTPRQQKWFTSYLNYVWGHYYFLLGENNKALGFITQCIDLYDAELDAILANAYLLQGQIHDNKHQRREAISAYKNCIKLDNHAHAIILAKQYLDEPYQG